jgi:hypothetical protein
MDSQELREFYARMNEGELAKIAAEAYDLTEVARSALSTVIAKRKLAIPLTLERPQRKSQPTPPPPSGGPADLDLNGWWVFETLAEARKVKQFLNDSGIPCFWGADNVDDPEELAWTLDEGLKMKVRTDDVPRVLGALSQLFANEPDDPTEPEVGDFAPACPKCKSPDIVFHEIDGNTTKFRWSCDACGHLWEDDGVEEPYFAPRKN